jgi:23S rRNA pseudouridine1911/1915/1917 synthase
VLGRRESLADGELDVDEAMDAEFDELDIDEIDLDDADMEEADIEEEDLDRVELEETAVDDTDLEESAARAEEQRDELADEDEVLRSTAMRPGIVHRLDKDTSGVMVVGKNYAATLHLSNQFAARTVSREYVALAWGVIKDTDRSIETQYGRSTRDRKLHAVLERGGKYAATDVHVVERYESATLVSCKLHTGRTHQIRVHLAHIKHPLVGDADYGGRDIALNSIHHLFRRRAQSLLQLIQRQSLHARSLEFTHPATGERMMFTSAVPSDFLSVVQAVRPPEAGPLPPCLS